MDDAGDGPWGDGCAFVDTKLLDKAGKITWVSDLAPVRLVEGYGGLHRDECIDGLPMTFVYNPGTKPVRVRARTGGREVELHRGSGPGILEHRFDEGFPPGVHEVELTITVGGPRIVQHEAVTVRVE